MRAASNPGGRGHSWVKRRFVQFASNINGKSDARDDIKKFRNGVPLPVPSVYVSPPSQDALQLARDSGKPAQGAYFVPAFLKDNPGLDIQGYEANLAKLDPVTRAQLKNGDWDVISSGNLFKAEWFKFLAPTAVPASLRCTRSWDFAATEAEKGKDPDYTAGAKIGIDRADTGEKRLIITAMEHFRENPGVTQKRLLAAANIDGKRVPILLEQEGGSAGKTLVHHFKTNLLFGWIVHSMSRTGSKEDYWKPVSALAESGSLWLVEGQWNEEFIEELTGLPDGSHDDMADAVALGWAWMTGEGSGAERTRQLVGM